MKQSNEESDISLYETPSLIASSCDGSPRHCLHQQNRNRGRPLEDLDSNSQDSGYGASYVNDPNRFFSLKMSFNSHGSADDDFFDICGLDEVDEKVQLPGDFSKLISGSLLPSCNLKRTPEQLRPVYRHSVSLKETTTSNINRIRSCLFKREDEVKCFKRPEPPTEIQSPKSTKRSKNELVESFKPRPLMRSISLPANEDSIKSALQRSSDEPDLIGDFSKQFCLPLTIGKHADLKSILSSTLALLLRGHFHHRVADFKIIDCRYPYEYNGGHIQGALNLYTKDDINDFLNVKIKQCAEGQAQDDSKRDILIFHCEFSSERGPNLFRFLRQVDRNRNKDVYPYLHYPEIYLLDGGYKDFYQQYSELCVPEAYLPMLHPNYEHDLKHFRTKSKTLNVDTRSKPNSRALLFKRL